MSEPSVQLLQGDALEVLRAMPPDLVDCVVTSPPYWGLRDFGTARWEGGDDPACDHKPPDEAGVTHKPTAGQREHAGRFSGPACWKCGAQRVDGQLGLQSTPEDYVADLVAVFHEVRRVLKPAGTLWLNLGDSYATIGRSKRRESPGVGATQAMPGLKRSVRWKAGDGSNFGWTLAGGQKHKDLVGIPWMVAFALRADGWYLRADIIWSKPNAMPESVADRPTKAHEYLFLLARSRRYHYDGAAIAEARVGDDSRERNGAAGWDIGPGGDHGSLVGRYSDKQAGLATASVGGSARTVAGFNARWDAKERAEYNGKHAAADAQAPGRRMVLNTKAARAAGGTHDNPFGETRNKRDVWTIATQGYPEAHFATYPEALVEPCVLAGCPPGGLVLDPFVGAGTTLAVAKRLGRASIGIDLNPEYLELARRRVARVTFEPELPFEG